MTKSSCKYVGVDRFKDGWFSVGLGCSGDYEVKRFRQRSFDEVLRYYCNAILILVDMPIGLVECGPCERDCDHEARKLLCRRGSSVFAIPNRKLVHKIAKIHGHSTKYEDRYKEANELARRLTHKGISRQAFGIVPQIAQIDKIMASSERPSNVREVHPELCFWALNNKEDMKYTKGTSEGIDERKKVLRCSELQTDEIFACARSKYPHTTVVKDDDILDALVAAVTAKLGYTDAYTLQSIPAIPQWDEEKCLRMEMVYAIKKAD